MLTVEMANNPGISEICTAVVPRRTRALGRRPKGYGRQAGPRSSLSAVTHAVRAPTSTFLGVLCAALIGTCAARAERVTQGELQLENIPSIPKEVSAVTGRYENVRSARLLSWKPDGQGMLIATRFGQTSQVHHVIGRGAARRQLTFFDEPVEFASYSPNPRLQGFVFSRDVGGGEFDQYFWMDASAGKASLLTDGKSVNRGQLWTNRGEGFAYVSTRRNGRDFDLYYADMKADRGSRLVLEREGYWIPLDWSPDDRKLALARYISVAETRIEILDVASGKTVPFNPQPEGGATIAYRGLVWAGGSDGVFIVSDEKSEFQRLRHWNLDTGEQTMLTPDLEWDVETLAISRDRRTLAFAVNEGGRSALYLMDAASRRRQRVDQLPLGVIGGLEFSPDGARLGFNMSTASSPADAFALELGSGEIGRWTSSEVGDLNPNLFIEPELIEFPTFDEIALGARRMIPAWIFRPMLDAGETAPVLILIHGGPEGQSRPTFSSTIQLYARELGYAVIQPNVRGSTGYGKTYVSLDNAMQREDSVRDIGALIDWIATQPGLDPKRVVAMGGSYGGYMALASMTHFNDRLAGGVSVVGISNFVTFLTNTQDYRRDLRRVEYGDERDPEMMAFLEQISPLNNIGKVSRPMLIIQGANDPRVPASESEQVVEALKKNGVEPWYMLAMNEGHGFRKKENIDVQRDVTFLFLKTLLRR